MEGAMYLKSTVKIPELESGISEKKIKGTTYIYYEYGRKYYPNKKYTVPQCTSIGKKSPDDSSMMYEAVKSGNAVACFEDYPVMAYGVQQGNGLKLLVENTESYATPYGFAVKKGENSELIDMFNAGLANIKENGTYQEIIDKYTKGE